MRVKGQLKCSEGRSKTEEKKRRKRPRRWWTRFILCLYPKQENGIKIRRGAEMKGSLIPNKWLLDENVCYSADGAFKTRFYRPINLKVHLQIFLPLVITEELCVK